MTKEERAAEHGVKWSQYRQLSDNKYYHGGREPDYYWHWPKHVRGELQPNGKYKTEIIMQREPGYLNRNLDCYDAYYEGQYVTTIHLTRGADRRLLYVRLRMIMPQLEDSVISYLTWKLTAVI